MVLEDDLKGFEELSGEGVYVGKDQHAEEGEVDVVEGELVLERV